MDNVYWKLVEEKYPDEKLSKNPVYAIEAIGYISALKDFLLIDENQANKKLFSLSLIAYTLAL